jgi:hypothetical protein
MTRQSVSQPAFSEPRQRSPQPAASDADQSVRVLFVAIHPLPHHYPSQQAMWEARQPPPPISLNQPPAGVAPGIRRPQAAGAINDHRFTPRPPVTGQRPPAPSADTGTRGQAPGGLRTAIPERWIKYWEFQISREEALYDLQFASSRSNSPAALFRRLTGWFGHRRAWRKWQALLTGRSLDEQLWAVRPPKGGLAHPAVREWARRTLELAGYDAGVMLTEWEIFWRRKGL